MLQTPKLKTPNTTDTQCFGQWTPNATDTQNWRPPMLQTLDTADTQHMRRHMHSTCCDRVAVSRVIACGDFFFCPCLVMRYFLQVNLQGGGQNLAILFQPPSHVFFMTVSNPSPPLHICAALALPTFLLGIYHHLRVFHIPYFIFR